MEKVCIIGICEKWFDSFALSTPCQFYDFLSFLKTQQGQEGLHKLHTRTKLGKRSGGALTVFDTGFFAMFDAQWDDMTSTISSRRAEIEARLAKADATVCAFLLSTAISIAPTDSGSVSIQQFLDYLISTTSRSDSTILETTVLPFSTVSRSGSFLILHPPLRNGSFLVTFFSLLDSLALVSQGSRQSS
ncbi:hypothetical protein V8G54_012327 [Vigna mungo]|uniref:Uncharacterized protein n=1 Tax=Vigna mungo TaxID=3915 RepID=A0AAQ3S3P8_VIGMU